MPLDDPISESERARAVARRAEVVQRGKAIRRRRRAVRLTGFAMLIVVAIAVPLGFGRSHPSTTHVFTTTPGTTTSPSTAVTSRRHTTVTSLVPRATTTVVEAPATTAVPAVPVCDPGQLFAATAVKEGFNVNDPWYSVQGNPRTVYAVKCAGAWAVGSPDRINVAATDGFTIFHWVNGTWTDIGGTNPPCPSLVVEAGLPLAVELQLESHDPFTSLFQEVDRGLCVPPVDGMTALPTTTGPYGFDVPTGWSTHLLSGAPTGIRSATFTDPASAARIDYTIDRTPGHSATTWPDRPHGGPNLTKALALDANCHVTATYPQYPSLLPGNTSTDLTNTPIVGFDCASPAGLETHGLLYVSPTSDRIITLKVTLPPTHRGTAAQILFDNRFKWT
jgi:hypothetical protein